MNKTIRIKEFAKEVGFDLVGITPADPSPDFDFFRWWLDQGYAAQMGYLKRGEEKRGNPEKILPGVKSVICCGMNYYVERPRGEGSPAVSAELASLRQVLETFGKPSPLGLKISRYAWGEDYHTVVGERLKKLELFIRTEIDRAAQTKSYVDTGPILERSYGALAGLGWIGKNCCLINNGVGSYLFLGEILTTLEFGESEYDRPAVDQCGSCTRCLDACPTQALIEPGVLDANRCIAYLTVEHRGEFTAAEAAMVGSHLYGCDICQEVCPYNDRIPATPLPEFQPRPELSSLLKATGPEEFRKLTEKSAMNRIKFSQWESNLKAVKNNLTWRKGPR